MPSLLTPPLHLDETETRLIDSRASRQTEFLIPIGGRLSLTDRRLVFSPDRISNFAGDHEPIEIPLEAIEAIEIRPGDLGNLLAGSFQKRLAVRTKIETYLFHVWGLGRWRNHLNEAIADG